MNSKPVLTFTEVFKEFPSPAGAVGVLHGISVAVQRGDFLGITGPSGSGKSTFLNLAGLLDRPTRGHIELSDLSIEDQKDARLAKLRSDRIGMVFQKFCLLPGRSVLENVLFRFRYHPLPYREARQRAEQALEQVGMMEFLKRPARLLSGGEMQRVAIARAVALEPDLLLADEPTGNLDEKNSEEIMGCFSRLNARGITVLLATHNHALLPWCNRHVVFQSGRLQEAPR